VDSIVENVRIVQRRCGGWLVTSPCDSALQIGVVGATKGSALLAYEVSLREWMHILTDPDSQNSGCC